jgi:hypothetical protein
MLAVSKMELAGKNGKIFHIHFRKKTTGSMRYMRCVLPNDYNRENIKNNLMYVFDDLDKKLKQIDITNIVEVVGDQWIWNKNG